MKFITQYLTFTPTEYEIIADRLEGAPDAIADALGIDIAVVETIQIHDRTKKSVTLIVPKAAHAALAEALEGSTYLARGWAAFKDYELSAPRYHARVRAAKSAVAKLNNAGIPCGDVPRI